jgi:voltage-gated potassium channel
MVGTISASMTAYFKARIDVKDLSISDLKDHTIVCGWDRMGGMILSELESSQDIWNNGVVVVAETDDNILENIGVKNPRRLFHICEDFTKMDVLEAVGAKRARAAVVLADKGDNLKDQDRDARTVLAALTLEKLNPDIFTCAELLDEVNATHLRIAGVEEIISRTSLTAGLFASTLVNRGISSLIADVLSHKEGTYLKKVRLPDEYQGKTYIEVFNTFKHVYDTTILAVDWVEESGKSERHINPPHERKMDKEDILVVMTNVGSKLMNIG